MEEKLSALYSKLAGHIVSMIPVRWGEFHYLGEVEQGEEAIPRCSIFKTHREGNL